MQLNSIVSSTLVRFMGIGGLKRIFLPDFSRRLAEFYRFVEFPKNRDDFKLENSIEFAMGFSKARLISRVQIYETGVVIEGPEYTEALEEIADEILSIIANEFGVALQELGSARGAYTSRIEIKSEKKLNIQSPLLNNIGNFLSKAIDGYGTKTKPYEIYGIEMHSEARYSSPIHPTRFTLERRAGTDYSDDIFYSEAPLKTKDHLQLLQNIESAI